MSSGAADGASYAHPADARHSARRRRRRRRRRRKGSGRPTLLHWIHYLAARTFAAVARWLSVGGAYRLARWGAAFLHLVARRPREVARRNLREHFRREDGTALSEAEVRRLARGVIGHMVMCGVEMILLERELARRGLDGIADVQGLEHMRAALEDGRGVVFVTAHLGNWELFGATSRELGLDVVSVYRPLDNPLMDKWLWSLRGGMGQGVIPKKGAVRGMMRALREGKVVAMVIDQKSRKHGVWAPFFGRPAATIRTPAELALRTGAAIIPGFSIRTGPGMRFRNWFEEPVEARATGDRDADLVRITTELNLRLESAIRQAPEQWLWVHNRWKYRPPEGETGARVRKRPRKP